jgi:hypothetical protein
MLAGRPEAHQQHQQVRRACQRLGERKQQQRLVVRPARQPGEVAAMERSCSASQQPASGLLLIAETASSIASHIGGTCLPACLLSLLSGQPANQPASQGSGSGSMQPTPHKTTAPPRVSGSAEG